MDWQKPTKEWCKNTELMKEPWFKELDRARIMWSDRRVRNQINSKSHKRACRGNKLSAGDVVISSVTGRKGVVIYRSPVCFFPWWVAWDDGDTSGGYQASCFIWEDVGP